MLPALFRWLPSTAAILLIGCAAVKPQPVNSLEIYSQHLASLANINQFDIRGRIGVQTDGRGFSGSTHWQHANTGDKIGLFSPLGGQVATINTSTAGVELIASDGKSYYATDAATLTQQILGWSLPMQGLPDWVLGRPAAGPVTHAQWDAAGRLTRLKQDGWDIEYPQYAEASGYQLPSKINLRSPKLNLKLIIERWSISPGQVGHDIGKQEGPF